MAEPLKNRYEFVFYFDVENGNPNGDPDAGNMPRIDPQTGHGLVTDVCLKRKVRNYVELAKENRAPVSPDEKDYDIYVTAGAILNNKQSEAYEELKIGKAKKAVDTDRNRAQAYMCRKYFDIRTFGAVMDTGDAKCGQVRGPVQFCFSRSEDPILQQEITITRMAATTENEKANENRTMGRKYVVPYGLYRAEGFISAKFAQKTGFDEEDLSLFWEALLNMFDQDHSAARGRMNARKLFVFQHESELGNAPAAALFSLITAERVDMENPPRAFSDYRIHVGTGLPVGVVLQVKL